MATHDPQQDILRELGQKVQECRDLIDRVDGGYTVRLLLDKVLEKVLRWDASNRDPA